MSDRNIYFILVAGSLFVLMIPLINAISAVPVIFEESYVPGQDYEFTSQVWGVDSFNISFNSILTDVGEVLDISKNEQNVYTVKWGFKMPDLPPGKYDPLILFTELPPPRKYGEKSGSGISALSAVGVPVRFFNPFPEKYLSLSGFEWDQEVKKAGTLFFKAKLQNMGVEVIDNVKGNVNIFGQEREYSVPFTTAENLKTSDKIELVGEWHPPEDLPFGQYSLKGEIEYDNNKLNTSEYYFIYGGKVLKIISLFPTTIKAGEISEMNVKVKNYWGEEIHFSVEVKAFDQNDTLVLKTESANNKVERYAEKDVRLYLDTISWNEGNYLLKVDLNYEGEPSSSSFEINVTAPAEAESKRVEEPNSLNSLLLILVIILILALLIYGLWKFTLNKKEKEEL